VSYPQRSRDQTTTGIGHDLDNFVNSQRRRVLCRLDPNFAMAYRAAAIAIFQPGGQEGRCQQGS
jgi:hypothetical protein